MRKELLLKRMWGDYFEPDIEQSRYTNNGIPLIIQELMNNLILKSWRKEIVLTVVEIYSICSAIFEI